VQTEQRNSLRLLQWMMAASLALPIALFGFASAVSYISTRDTADREILRTLDVAHEHALKVFETIDRSLSEINEIIRGIPDAGIQSREETLHLRLKQLVDSLPQMKSVWIFDAHGHALVNSLMSPAPDIDFSDRDYFRAHLAQNIGTFIGEALTPRAPYQGAAFFGVSRRRQTDDGNFAGVIQASVFPEYFQNFYARISHDPGSFFALGLADGTVLARFPVSERDVRIDRNGPIGQELAANPKAGLVTVTSPADGIERRLGYHRLTEYPVYVSAGLETSAIRSRWLTTIGSYLIFGLPATALLFLILSLALRRTQRLYFESAKRMEAEEALKHGQRLARISHRVKRIGAPNQRKLFCENDFLMIRGEPRCRQSVSRIFLDLKPSKAARWWRRLMVVRSHRMRGRCCWARRTGRSGWWIGWHRALLIGDRRRRSSILSRRWSGSGYSPSRSATRTSTTMRRCATIH
jgi:two-component system NtrC family sensor kinase